MEPRWHKRMVMASSSNGNDSSSSSSGEEMMVAIGGLSLSRTKPTSRPMGVGSTWNSYGHGNCRWEDQQPANQILLDVNANKSVSDSILTMKSSVPLAAGLLYGNHGGTAATVHSLQQRSGTTTTTTTNAAVLTQSTEAVNELLSTIAERCQQQQAAMDMDASSSSSSKEPQPTSSLPSSPFSSSSSSSSSSEEPPPMSFSSSSTLSSSSSSSSPMTVVAPEQECHVLAQWAAMETHYRVVIAALGGIPKLVAAMRLFATDAGLQTACCTAIENICQRNGSNQLAVYKAGGVDVIVKSMRNHPQSITVQSAAIAALRCLNAIIMLHVIPSNKLMAMELVWLLQHARKMYITTASRESLDFLLTQLRWS